MVILSKFKGIHDFMTVFDTCKNEEDPIKNEGARYATTLYIDFSDAVRAVSGGIWPKIELIQAYTRVVRKVRGHPLYN